MLVVFYMKYVKIYMLVLVLNKYQFKNKKLKTFQSMNYKMDVPWIFKYCLSLPMDTSWK